MKILVVHNAYQHSGGEDGVVSTEIRMLEEAGHSVSAFLVDNNNIRGFTSRVIAATQVVSNPYLVAEFRKTVLFHQPDVVYFHNTFPRISVSAIAESVKLGFPTVQTLHNFRMLCANGLFLRGGKICERCVSNGRMNAVVHRCYRSSLSGSIAAMTAGAAHHSLACTQPGPTMIALTTFARAKFVSAGVPSDAIVVKGNTAEDPGVGENSREKRVVFIGRLSAEKGVLDLMRAANRIKCEIEVIGDGPEMTKLKEIAPSNVTFRGYLPRYEALERLKTATALVLPSKCYEGFPLTLVEAFATGTPVIASDFGPFPELVQNNETGFLYSPSIPGDLAMAINRVIDDPEHAVHMGASARRVYETKHSPSHNVMDLIDSYQFAIRRAAEPAAVGSSNL